MKYSKVIQFRALVKHFNQERIDGKLPVISFESMQFAEGSWGVSLMATSNSLFYSVEMKAIVSLCAKSRLSIVSGCTDGCPMFVIQ